MRPGDIQRVGTRADAPSARRGGSPRLESGTVASVESDSEPGRLEAASTLPSKVEPTPVGRPSPGKRQRSRRRLVETEEGVTRRPGVGCRCRLVKVRGDVHTDGTMATALGALSASLSLGLVVVGVRSLRLRRVVGPARRRTSDWKQQGLCQIAIGVAYLASDGPGLFNVRGGPGFGWGSPEYSLLQGFSRHRPGTTSGPGMSNAGRTAATDQPPGQLAAAPTASPRPQIRPASRRESCPRVEKEAPTQMTQAHSMRVMFPDALMIHRAVRACEISRAERRLACACLDQFRRWRCPGDVGR